MNWPNGGVGAIQLGAVHRAGKGRNKCFLFRKKDSSLPTPSVFIPPKADEKTQWCDGATALQ